MATMRMPCAGSSGENVFELHKATTSDMTTAQNLVVDFGFAPKKVFFYGYYTPASYYVTSEYDADNLGATKQLYAQKGTQFPLDLRDFGVGGAGRIESLVGSTMTFYYVGTYFTNLTVVAIG